MQTPRRYAPMGGSFAPVRVAGFSGIRNFGENSQNPCQHFLWASPSACVPFFDVDFISKSSYRSEHRDRRADGENLLTVGFFTLYHAAE